MSKMRDVFGVEIRLTPDEQAAKRVWTAEDRAARKRAADQDEEILLWREMADMEAEQARRDAAMEAIEAAVESRGKVGVVLL